MEKTTQLSIKQIYDRLHTHFGYQNWWPILHGDTTVYLPEYRVGERPPEDIFQIALGAILTQNTAWKNVKLALLNLKNEGMLNLEGLRLAEVEAIAGLVRPSGYYNQKAKKIKALIRLIDDELSGNIMLLRDLALNEAREKLLSVWGIGKETADSILLYGFAFEIFMVDAYTKRIFSRLGMIDQRTEYDDVRAMFERELGGDNEVYREYHGLIVRLGNGICKTKAKCGECPLRQNCIYQQANTIS